MLNVTYQFEIKSNQSYFVDPICNERIFLLAFLNSNLYLLWLGKVFFLLIMAFFYLGLAKGEEFLMISIEKITLQKCKTTCANSKEIVGKKLWSNVVADLTLRALGSHSFEILYPLAQMPFTIYAQSTEQSIEFYVIIVS